MSELISQTPEWTALVAHADDMTGLDLRNEFRSHPDRATGLTVDAADLALDLSKNLITPTTVDLLCALADRAGLEERREAMFTGEAINTTEDRPVLHTALRAPRDATIEVDGANVVPAVHEVLDRMREFAAHVRSGDWRGATGQPIRTVVNIGIGGSDLGPAMAARALAPHMATSVSSCDSSANVDPAHLIEAVRDLDPASTLFVVASKTFTTLETLANARSSSRRAWLLDALDDPGAVASHFVAVSTNAAEVGGFRDRSRRTCSSSGTGWAAGTASTRRSV